MNFIHNSYKYTLIFSALLFVGSQTMTRAQSKDILSYKKIQISSDSIVFFSGPPFSNGFIDNYLNKKKLFRSSSAYNNIQFVIDAPDTGFLYSYKLEGLTHTWTVWQRRTNKEYTHLQPGRYTFYARGMDPQGRLYDLPEFHFQVISPLHRSWMAVLAYSIVGILFLLSFLRSWRYRYATEKFKLEKIINARTEEMIREKEKSESLLANVLPKDTADELKKDGKVAKKKFRMVTVLFSDIQGFTKIAEQMNPEALIDELDKFFFHFDSVVEKYNIEKIKTIGDAYMCAGGIPDKNRTNPVEVVLAALEMQKYMRDLHKKAKRKKSIWDIRIGIHTGPVIAGVVGHKKLSYDIWGDTVNTASRMESSGEAGKINISGSTYELIKEYFICEYRGKMPVKYKGEIDMYFVKGIRPELSVDITGIPNERFYMQLQSLRLLDLEEDMVGQLEMELPENLYFHNIKHALNVYTQVELLGRALEVGEEDLLLLRTAGLLHDAGMLKDYDNHEEAGCEFARTHLPRYSFNETQINRICGLIMATKIPHNPQDLQEMIICDADMNHLGRVDYVPLSLNLYRELKERNRAGSFEDWKKEQIGFLQKHDFYTDIAKRLREVSRAEQIKYLKASMLENELF